MPNGEEHPLEQHAQSHMKGGSDPLNWEELADFVKLEGDIMTGLLTLSGPPVSDLHAVTKKYMDDHLYSPLVLDAIEYADDAAAQAAYPSSDAIGDLDLMEYADDAAAQAAYVCSGGASLLEDFSSDPGWTSVGFGGWSWHADGYMKMTTTGPNAENSFLRSGHTTTDFILQAKVQQNGVYAGLGIGFRENGSGAFYSLLMRCNATGDAINSMHFYKQSGVGTITSLGSLAVALSIDTYYWLKVIVHDNNIRAYYSTDGEEWIAVCDVDDETHASGYVGCAAWDERTNGKIDDFSCIPFLQCYSEDTIVEQGSYSLKGIAKATGSLNETLTRTIDPTIDLSGIDTIYFYIYSTRTGSNIKVGFHDSGGVTTEVTPNIASANVWQLVEVDISAVADGDKDAIDSIIITIVNADSDNTFYLDGITRGSLQCYSESSIKQQGFYSLKAFAKETDSLNETLTKTFTLAKDLSGQAEIKFYVRASREGTNFKVGFHDSGGTTTEHSVNIAVANVWQEEEVDISEVSDANKDDIDSIIITITNADADNIIYLDYINAPDPGVLGGEAGFGDMLKSVYDTDDDGRVNDAAKLAGYTLAQTRDHAPRTHTLNSHSCPDGNVDFGGYKGVDVANPTNPQDAATKAYVDSLV